MAKDKRKPVKKWSFPSTTTEGKVYTVTRWDTGEMSCSCPAWVFKRPGQGRGCLHIAGVMASEALPEGMQAGQAVTLQLPREGLVEGGPAKRRVLLED
jgi:SWIM zinc finger